MKLIGISRVKNEIDIIEAFVRHNARHVDKLLILDDGSTDGSYEVLCALRDAGLPLVVLREASIGYEQSRYMTRLLHMAVQQFGADWVVPLDADEFLEPAEGTTLAEILAASGPAPLAISWSNFVCGPKDESLAEINPVMRLRWRMPPYSILTKALIPAAMFQQRRIELTQGNHGVLCDGRLLPGAPLDSVALCHYPIRSLEQYAAKIALGYLQYCATPRWNQGVGHHYIKPFWLLAGGLDQLAGAMAADSRRYSLEEHDPAPGEPREAPLRYAGGALTFTPPGVKLIANVLLTAEAIARDRAEGVAQLEALRSALTAATPELAAVSPTERILSLQRAMREARRSTEETGAALIESQSRLAGAQHQLAAAQAEATRLAEDKAILDARLLELEAERVRLHETLYRQAVLLTSRTFRLAQQLQVRVARTGLPTRAIADRLSQLFGIK